MLTRILGGLRPFRWASLTAVHSPPDLAFTTELQRVSGCTWPQTFVAMTTCLLGSVMILFYFFLLQEGKTSQQGLNKSCPILLHCCCCSRGKPRPLSMQLGPPCWGSSLGIHTGSLDAQQPLLAPQRGCSCFSTPGTCEGTSPKAPFLEMTLQPILNRPLVNQPHPLRGGMGVLMHSQRTAALNGLQSLSAN